MISLGIQVLGSGWVAGLPFFTFTTKPLMISNWTVGLGIVINLSASQPGEEQNLLGQLVS